MSLALVFRVARKDEADLIAHIDEAAFQRDKLGADQLGRLIATGGVLVAELGGGVAGFCALRFRPDRPLAILEGIAVSAEHTGRGIGTALLRAAEQEALRNGRFLLQLHVRADNPRGIAFYRSVGFRRLWRIGRGPEIYLDGVHAIRMRKRLRSVGSQLSGILSVFTKPRQLQR